MKSSMKKNTLLSTYCALAMIAVAPASVGSDEIKNGPIPVMIDVPKTTFIMGRADDMKGESDEVPQYEVHLSAHQIGKYEVTNAQYAAVLNWAKEQGYLQSNPLRRLTDTSNDNVYFNGRMLKVINKHSEIILENGLYTPIMRDGLFMDEHPVVDVTWSGAVAYANWLSEIQGLAPCYDFATFNRISPLPNGYRLPTEAEWEHAGGWQGSRAKAPWNFASSTDTITGQQGNFELQNPMHTIGMSTHPFTSPIGYFNGQSPNTLNSPSPVGCYDMSGNVQEWCEDWFSDYTEDTKTNPTGPESGAFKIVRGGGWNSVKSTCRTTNRGWTQPSNHFRSFGFRLARTPNE